MTLPDGSIIAVFTLSALTLALHSVYVSEVTVCDWVAKSRNTIVTMSPTNQSVWSHRGARRLRRRAGRVVGRARPGGARAVHDRRSHVPH